MSLFSPSQCLRTWRAPYAGLPIACKNKTAASEAEQIISSSNHLHRRHRGNRPVLTSSDILQRW